ncbi:TonB family protein [Dyella sp.]|uniref:energy transducer TonB n=1 Tax=Dyella sp. TaxID=1869338 RepID=UPI002ED235DB
MVSAGLAVAHRSYPDSTRIAALSVAIALNLAGLLLVLRPIAPQIAELIKPTPVPTIRWIQTEPLPPAPPALVMMPKAPVVTPRITHTVPKPPVAPSVVPQQLSDEGTIAPQVVNAQPQIEVATPSVPDKPVEATLAYRTAPLSYPREGLQRRLSGTVLLRVLVDENGKPIQVEIEKPSGQPLLDRSARDQVLAKWLFQPATISGQHVKAWARVPVTFNLN